VTCYIEQALDKPVPEVYVLSMPTNESLQAQYDAEQQVEADAEADRIAWSGGDPPCEGHTNHRGWKACVDPCCRGYLPKC